MKTATSTEEAPAIFNFEYGMCFSFWEAAFYWHGSWHIQYISRNVNTLCLIDLWFILQYTKYKGEGRARLCTFLGDRRGNGCLNF